MGKWPGSSTEGPGCSPSSYMRHLLHFSLVAGYSPLLSLPPQARIELCCSSLSSPALLASAASATCLLGLPRLTLLSAVTPPLASRKSVTLDEHHLLLKLAHAAVPPGGWSVSLQGGVPCVHQHRGWPPLKDFLLRAVSSTVGLISVWTAAWIGSVLLLLLIWNDSTFMGLEF